MIKRCIPYPLVISLAVLILPLTSLPTLATAMGNIGVSVQVESADGQYSVDKLVETELSWSDVLGNPDELYSWNMAEGELIELKDGDVLLGTISKLWIEIEADPVVSLGFYVTATGSDTAFNIGPDVLTFPAAAIENPDAIATASITLTDNNGDGATLTGAFGDGSSYQARYNNTHQLWSGLINGVTADYWSSATANGRNPVSGWGSINDTVSSMESEFNFTLSAGDSASGTSSFVALMPIPELPEPATVALLGLGSLVLLRRKK